MGTYSVLSHDVSTYRGLVVLVHGATPSELRQTGSSNCEQTKTDNEMEYWANSVIDDSHVSECGNLQLAQLPLCSAKLHEYRQSRCTSTENAHYHCLRKTDDLGGK